MVLWSYWKKCFRFWDSYLHHKNFLFTSLARGSADPAGPAWAILSIPAWPAYMGVGWRSADLEWLWRGQLEWPSVCFGRLAHTCHLGDGGHKSGSDPDRTAIFKQASACATFTNIPLAKADHMASPEP